MIHALHLAILRNRNNILFSATATILLSTLILTMIVLFQVSRQNDRIEQTIKGLSCISLIPVPDRTELNVTNCVKKNDSKPDNTFQFNPPTSSNSGSTNANPSVSSQPNPSITPTMVSQTPLPTITTEPGISAQPVLQVSLPVPETRIDVDGVIQVKYPGDNVWVSL